MPVRQTIWTTAGRGRLFDSILDTVGDTPAIRINNLGVDHATIYVKAEFFNPAASVKDRLALNIIEEGERSGALKPGQTVVEATSGNTGIGLAMVCAQKGYPLVVTMADSFSIERRKLMRMLGAKVVLTPRAQKGFGMYKKAVELRRSQRLVPGPPVRDQGQRRHSRGDDRRARLSAISPASGLICFVTGYGTGGTVAGVGRVLRRERPQRPHRPLRARQRAAGWQRGARRKPAGTARPPPAIPPGSRTRSRAGRRTSFPRCCRRRSTTSCSTRCVPVAGAEGIKWAKALAQKEGIFTGISGGSTFAAARRIAEAAPAGSVILCMLPDTGERYMTTPLFDGIEAEMDEEEMALSRSTPSAQYAPA